MTSETIAIIAVIFAGLTFVTNIVEKIFGGSTRLAQSFHSLDVKTTAAIQSLRDEILNRVSSTSDNARVGYEAITANIHSLQLAHLEFRAKIAEQFQDYMKISTFDDIKAELKREFNEKHNDLKADMHEGFERLEKSVEAVSMSIESARKEREITPTKK
jgi:hypothetical protein